MNSEYIALVRSNPCVQSDRALLAALASAGNRHASSTVFFHGDGCRMAHRLAGGALEPGDADRLDLRVCATSWARRYGPTPPPPLQAASLALFFQRMAPAQRVDSFSPGGWFCCVAPNAGAAQRSSSRLLLLVATPPDDERQQRETLEVAIGAAALELEGGVLFQGSGSRHLAGEAGRGWRQISDFGLLEMLAQGAGDQISPDSGVVFATPGRAARRYVEATTILLL